MLKVDVTAQSYHYMYYSVSAPKVVAVFVV